VSDDERDRLRAAIGRLPHPERQVAELHLLRERTIASIAGQLGISTASAQTFLDSAQDVLRTKYGFPQQGR
jgi:DNA-directed RNA polymerase specialized sigma24 family protein